MAAKLTARSIIRDVRAQGSGALVRAGYEASKALGGHRAVFGWLARSTYDAPLRSPMWAPAEVPEAMEARTLAAADRIVSGDVELFGRTIRVGQEVDWHQAVETDARWPAVPWWQIDLRTGARIADVKWVWELGRHRHIVLLARAAHLRPGDPRYAHALDGQLASWLSQNPPEIGVHWYSNLEVALRAVAWLQVVALAGDRLNPEVRGQMASALYHSGRHLIADLPYTLSAMPNNHLLGDGLGLVALGKAFPESAAAARWARWGDRIMTRQLRRHMREDGSSMEDSVSYHRFVLEMLAVRVVLGDPPAPVSQALEAGAQFLARLGALDGPVPQYGDWDSGRVLTVSGPPGEIEGSVRLALALVGSGAPDAWRAKHDECAWYVGRGEPAGADAAESGGGDVGGAIGRAQSGPFSIWLKTGSGPSHGHADLTSLAVGWNGMWVFGDPGTGTYNGPRRIRDYFRISRSHNVLRVAGEDQLVPHRVFRWVHRAEGRLGRPIATSGHVVMWGVHDAYRRFDPPRRIARVVTLTPMAVQVADFVEGPPVVAQIGLSLPPAVGLGDGELLLPGDSALLLDFPGSTDVARGVDAELFDGWWSDTYGHTTPAYRLEATVSGAGPFVWGVRSPEVGPPRAEASRARLGNLDVEVAWQPDVITLSASHPGGTETSSIAW